ncbi:MAG: LytR family transcriptional regulator, partial [Candidatus Daviesbacteria bacterium GW2011_GWF2_38_6]
PDGSIATDSAEENKGIKYFSCRYEHVRFEKGLMHMSGAVALKFVRSRHGTNGEGSDFARSARQQKVIDAVRKKILSFETLTDPQKISDLVKTLGKSIDMDISVKDAIEFCQSFVLDDRKSLLVHPDASGYGGAFVLISQDDDFSIIHDYVRKILKEEITEYESTASARPGNK